MRSASWSLRLMLGWTVLFAGALLSACVGGQTGDEDAVPPTLPFPGSASRMACQFETTPTVIASPDETSPGGFSAASVLRHAEGTFSEPLVFDRRSADDRFDARTTLSIEPGGDEPLDIEISYAEGELRYFAPVDESCRGRLEIDVHVTLRTPSGAFDETVDGVLMASSASEARLWLRFHTAAVEPERKPSHLDLPVVPVHRLEGDLSVTAMNDTGRHRLAFVELWLTFSALGVNGYLDGWIYGVDGEQLAMLNPLATIGETCDAPHYGHYGYALDADQPLPAPDGMALSVREVLALLAEMRIDAVRDDDSRSPLPLDLEYRADSACTRPDEDTSLAFEAALPITADLGDATIDSRLPLEVGVRFASDGALANIHMIFAQPGGPSIGNSEFDSLETEWGVTGVDLDGYDEVAITFDLNIKPATDAPEVAGDLFILGLPYWAESTEDGDVLGHLRFEAAPSL